ncbi:MAG: glycoside hydrolase, partial [Bacteroidia bacterium]|nr:glycoside hydrolase [Bacteroidia bacterium]
YTGSIEMDSEENWELLENSYRNFIIDYAKLADNLKVEMLCIGTELDRFVQRRPEFWSTLIKEIKSVYNGRLTYAANWDEFKRVPFWNELDLIGVDAYFPLSESKTPTVEDCREGWQNHKSTIVEISRKHRKPVLFTEFGYRSVDYTAKEPWNSDRRMNIVNLTAQSNAMTALFEEFWDEPWFAGGFVWKWFHNEEWIKADENSLFTPQNKPVEQVIKLNYSKFKK